MKDKVFVDTNILIYLFSKDEPQKHDICISAFKNYQCITSTQALNELSNVFTKKWKLCSEDIKKAISDIKGLCSIENVTLETIDKALDIYKNYGFSYFDSLMLSSGSGLLIIHNITI